jgi:hypothetical protein
MVALMQNRDSHPALAVATPPLKEVDRRRAPVRQ